MLKESFCNALGGVILLLIIFQVTIAQAHEQGGRGCEPAGTRPCGHEVSQVMKAFLARDESTHGPLPKDNPNFAVFAAPDQDEGVLKVGAHPT